MISEEDTPGDKKIKSTDTTLDVLEAIAATGEVGVTELASELSYSKSTVHYYLKTLEQRQYVVRVDGRYRLGHRLLKFGGRVLTESALYGPGESETNELAAETGHVARLVVNEQGTAVVIHQTELSEGVTVERSVGQRLPLHASAAGKAILAHLPDDDIADFLDDDLPQYTDRTETDRDRITTDLTAVREYDVAFDDGELTAGQRAIAAPIHRDGNLLGAVSVIGPASDLPDPWKGGKARRYAEEIPQKIKRAARVIGNATDQ